MTSLVGDEGPRGLELAGHAQCGAGVYFIIASIYRYDFV